MDRRGLLTEIRVARERLEDVLARLTDEEMAERVNGDWSRTDVLSHFEAWEDRTVRLFAILRGERDFDPDEPGEVDEFNAWWHGRKGGRRLADVRASEAAAWEGVVALVESADEADLFDARRFEFLDGRAFEDVVRENTSAHYPDHLAQLDPGAG